MREPGDYEYFFEPKAEGSGLGSAFLMIVALAVFVIAFVWFVINLEPLTEDFIGGDQPTPTATQTDVAP